MSEQKKLIKAAGGIVERVVLSGVEIALIHRTRYGSEWSLPKGKVEENETWEEAAIREVREETGFNCTIAGFGDGISYLVNQNPKVVLFWKMNIKGKAEFKANDEVDQLEWLSPEKAISKLKHLEEINMIKQVYSIQNI